MAENQNKLLTPPTIDTWGTIGNLTPEQETALASFLRLATPADLEMSKFKIEAAESAALRFLRARNFDVNNALQLIRDCVKRRIEGRAAHYASLTDPDQCTLCDTEALKKFYPHGQYGYDRFNRPVLYEHSGAVDGNAITQMTTLDNLINYHWYSMDYTLNKMFEVAGQQGPLTISTCVVLDFTGLNSHHASSKVIDHVKAMVALDNTCYPEILGKMFVINAPWLAVTLWEMAKSWLDPRTQQKIEILGSGPETTERLLQYISADQLPRAYGGSAPNLFRPKHHTEFVYVPRSGVIKKTIHVPEHKKLIIESYVTEGDIGFEVYCRKVHGSTAGAHHVHQSTTVHSPTAGATAHHHPPQNSESLSISDWNRFITAHAKDWKLVQKKELKNTHPNQDSQGRTINRPPLKSVVEMKRDEGTHDYIIIWSNTAMFYSRPLVFNLILKDINPPPLPVAKSPSTSSISPVSVDEVKVEGI